MYQISLLYFKSSKVATGQNNNIPVNDIDTFQFVPTTFILNSIDINSFCPRQYLDCYLHKCEWCTELDAGFHPTQSKTQLERDHPFTVALQKLGDPNEMKKSSAAGNIIFSFHHNA